MAHLKAGHAAEAIRGYRAVESLRAMSATDAAHIYAPLGLARAYALQGDKAKARTAYQDFLARFKDADPDVPVVQEARAEYARLQ
jgi:cytochrome c-type biogenesis protein CcmH/NrfG